MPIPLSSTPSTLHWGSCVVAVRAARAARVARGVSGAGVVTAAVDPPAIPATARRVEVARMAARVIEASVRRMGGRDCVKAAPRCGWAGPLGSD